MHKAMAAVVAAAMAFQMGSWSLPAHAGEPSDDVQLVSGEVALAGAGQVVALDGGDAVESAESGGDASAAPANVAVVDTAAGEPEMVTGSVPLAPMQDAAAVLTQDGLTYRVVDEQARRAALVGWTGEAPQGELAVPAAVGDAGDPYQVTNISTIQNLGGGVDPLCQNGDSASTSDDPYIKVCAADADKALGVTSIVIPASVESIDPGFFQMFPNASAVTVDAASEHLRSYNGMLFNSDLSSLLLVPEGMEGVAVLPEGVASVPACVFSRCTKLLAISVPGSTGNGSLTSQDGLLYNADGTVLIAAPAGIGASAKLAGRCTRMSAGAFRGAAHLQTIISEGGVTAIDEGAFDEGAPAGISAVLPEGAPRDAWLAAGFTDFPQPASAGEASQPQEGSGFAFTLLDDGTLSAGWAGDAAAPADLRIPDYGRVGGAAYRVSRIADAGFSGLSSIDTVEFPATLTHIGAGAFEGCAGLQGATLPGGLSSIGQRAFANTALMSAVLPRSLAHVGCDAFAGLRGTTIIATGVVADVESGALGNSRGVSVYVPASGAPCAWDAGPAEAGNSIRAYGLRFSQGASRLMAGQSAELFGQDGYLLAPGDVQVTYSYRADHISVDTDAGVLTAKKSGPFKMDVTLSIPVREAVPEGLRERTVELSLAGLRDASGGPRQMAEAQRVQRTVADAYSLSGYVDDAGGRDIPIISVAVPMNVTFGGSEGYDVNDGQPDELTADAYFENNGAPVLITRIQTSVDDDCRLADAVASDDEAADPLAEQRLFTLVGAGADIPLRYDDAFNDATGTRMIGNGQRLDCRYVLDLSRAELLMDGGAADGSFIPLAKVTYTFSAAASAAGAGGAAGGVPGAESEGL